ncbi:hypothetical protein KSD_33700 [Ktedonobacter sp. SOSP1-85]|uniref:hypothetical protein n=1 Tax=Ktedonobacter sp. SOSP1-85 TaxID=2778367 RepID=UPI001916BD9D|nr:hypothetical protein [Ktedonobacter sp. SOSP1-85]GHO75599.1 hypothetical protein KSD_33700 [Ktedonobacter sp. SOSP1-85]
MGKASQRRKEAVRWREIVHLLRQKWLGQSVFFDVGQGQGVQYGRVLSISDEGDFFIEVFSASGERVSLVAMSPGYVERLLSLVGGV